MLIKVYVFHEHCVRKCQVCTPADIDRLISPDGVVSDDIWLWGEGSVSRLCHQARRDISTYRTNPTSYTYRCAENVLHALT